MKVITPAMDEAMREAGFTRRRTRWRRETPDLPVVVYQERPDTGDRTTASPSCTAIPTEIPRSGVASSSANARCAEGATTTTT